MKKSLQLLLLFSLLSSVVFPASTAIAMPALENGELSFVDLGLESDMVLHGPYDTGVIRFDLPATWALQPGAELAINITSLVTGNEAITQSTFSGATLEVYFNDKFQQSIPLLSNDKKIYYVPISPEALVSPNPGGWHDISFYLYSEFDCTLDFHRTTVTIDANSTILLPYEQTALSLDLRRLPWPIYLQHAKKIDPVSVIIPTTPTADEMQAALVVMGAFGRMTNGNLPLTMVTADKVTDEIRSKSNLIVVGKPAAFPDFANLSFPVPLISGQFLSPELQPDDGVLQILPSPWESTKSILMVSGNTDLAVVKAAQALSTLNLQTGNTADYSIIAQVSPLPTIGTTEAGEVSPQPADIKLSDLGYSSITSTGMGTNWIDYEFTIPLGMVPSETPYIDLSLSASSLVDINRSEGVVYLNDVQVGSIPLSTDKSNLIVTRLSFPTSVLRSGTNNLSVVLNLLPYDTCTIFAFSSLWATIYSDSVLHLPLTAAPASSFALQDIKGYPYPFAMDPSLSTTAFVLAQEDPSSWLQAGRIAYDLGARVAGPVLGFETAFSENLPDDIRALNLIVIGQPKTLSIVSDMKASLPAHFEDGSNRAILDTQQVVYRISDTKSLGYLQLFVSPWNDQAAVMGIFGTTANGLTSAINALLNAQSREIFSGNFITLDGTQAIVVDTRTGTGMGNVVIHLNPEISQNEEPIATSIPNGQTVFASSKQFILLGILTVIVLIATTIVAALVLRRNK